MCRVVVLGRADRERRDVEEVQALDFVPALRVAYEVSREADRELTLASLVRFFQNL